MRPRLPCTYAALFIVMVIGAGCACQPPRQEFTLARAALEHAKKAGSQRYASGNWHKAEEAYRMGVKLYKENDFCQARRVLLTSINNSERAENVTRLKKFQSGEVAP